MESSRIIMNTNSETGALLKKRQENKWLLVFESLLTGLLTGLVITGFRLSIAHIKNIRVALYGVIRIVGAPGVVLALAGLAPQMRANRARVFIRRVCAYRYNGFAVAGCLFVYIQDSGEGVCIGCRVGLDPPSKNNI